jgi:hypothetical protein
VFNKKQKWCTQLFIVRHAHTHSPNGKTLQVVDIPQHHETQLDSEFDLVQAVEVPLVFFPFYDIIHGGVYMALYELHYFRVVHTRTLKQSGDERLV